MQPEAWHQVEQQLLPAGSTLHIGAAALQQAAIESLARQFWCLVSSLQSAVMPLS